MRTTSRHEPAGSHAEAPTDKARAATQTASEATSVNTIWSRIASHVDAQAYAGGSDDPSSSPERVVYGTSVRRKCADSEEASATSPPPLQTKLTIGPADDRYEREADAVADRVMRMQVEPDRNSPEQRMPTGSRLQRQTLPYTNHVQRSSHADDPIRPGAAALQHAVDTPGSGSPLPDDLRARVEPALGTDLSHVRVHDDSTSSRAAREIQARAFTHKHHIYLGAGESRSDLALMAHEATHVVQQNQTGTASNIQARRIRQNYATAAYEVGPVWDVVLVIRGAPEGRSEALSDFIGACQDGIRDAAHSFGRASGIERREIRVTIRYSATTEYAEVWEQAYRLARISVLGEEPAPEEETPPAEVTTPPATEPETGEAPSGAAPETATETPRETLAERAAREHAAGSPELQSALLRSIRAPYDFSFSSELEGESRFSIRQGGGLQILVDADFAAGSAPRTDRHFSIEPYAERTGFDDAQGAVTFTAGVRARYTWSNLDAGSYYLRFQKDTAPTIRGSVWVDVLSGPGVTARSGSVEDQFERQTGVDLTRENVSGIAYGEYVLRSEPVRNSFIFGTLPGSPVHVTVIDKRSFDRSDQQGNDTWYMIAFADRETFERNAIEVPPEVGSHARAMYDAGHAWVTANALKIFVPYRLLLQQLRAFEARPEVAAMTLHDRVTHLRQLHSDASLPVDDVIGTEEGERSVEDRPELSNLAQMLKGPVTGVVLPGGEHIDFAHFILTLDAYSHPDRMASYTPGYSIPGIAIGPSRAVASWSGDVGGAVGDYTVEHEDEGLSALDSGLLDEHFEKSAPDADLRGNLDGLGAQLLLAQNPSITTIEQLTRLYFEGVTEASPEGDAQALTQHRAAALTAFLGSYGFADARNLAASADAVRCIVSDTLLFALIWYRKRRVEFMSEVIADRRLPTEAERAELASALHPPARLLIQATVQMVRRFFSRLQSYAAEWGVTVIPPTAVRSISCPAPAAAPSHGEGEGEESGAEEAGAETTAPTIRRQPLTASDRSPITVSKADNVIVQRECGDDPEQLSSIIFRRSPRLMRAYERGTVDISRTTGSRDSVVLIQQALIYLGYELGEPGRPDGDFGDGTEAAVSAFQRSMGQSEPTGHVDVSTLREMDTRVCRQDQGAPDSGVSATGPRPTKFSDYPATHIDEIDVDLAAQRVSLSWAGSGSATRDSGPFACSTGRGVTDAGDCHDCDDTHVSNTPGTNCTPKGRFTVHSIANSLSSYPEAMFVTFFQRSRDIALHYYPSVPSHPASHGCVRLHLYPAILIHDNVVAGTSQVNVHGTWSRYWYDSAQCTLRGIEEAGEGLVESGRRSLHDLRERAGEMWENLW